MAKGAAPGVSIDGTKLKEIMKKKGISSEKLARMMGNEKNTINTWIREKYRPREEKFMQLCAILDCNDEDLLKDPEPEHKEEPKVEEKAEPKMETDGILRREPKYYYETPYDHLIKNYMAEMHDLIEAERKENAELRDLLKEAIGAISTKTQEQAIEIGHISMELCDYGFRQFKKQATEKANIVMSRHKEYKSTNSVWSDVYKLLRAEYGVVWEQEKKEFLEVNGYSPASTLQLCYWIEANKPAYHNLFLTKLDTLAK